MLIWGPHFRPYLSSSFPPRIALFTHYCRMTKQLPISDRESFKKVSTFWQRRQSEISRYISTINMCMIGKKRRRASQYAALSETHLIFPWPWVPPRVWVCKSWALPPGETAAVKPNCFSYIIQNQRESWERIRTEHRSERFVGMRLWTSPRVLGCLVWVSAARRGCVCVCERVSVCVE